VAASRISVDEAGAFYRVFFDEKGSVEVNRTVAAREEARRERLKRAHPAQWKAPADVLAPGDPLQPLYPGIVQRGKMAFSERSGALLAVAPEHWTHGCPYIEDPLRDQGPTVVVRTWLDPESGRALHAEVVPLGWTERSFEVMPKRWTSAL
jgi:N-methylhydantoinase B